MNFMKYLKIFIFTIIALVVATASSWFITANAIKKACKNKYEAFSSTFEKIDISGFPFKFIVTIENSKLKYNNSLDIEFDKITAQTDYSFHELDIQLPKKIITSFNLKNQAHHLTIVSNGNFYLNFEEINSNNSLSILEAVCFNNTAGLELKLKNFKLHADELLISNTLNNQAIASEKFDIKLHFDQLPPASTRTEAKINLEENVLNAQEYFLHNFNKIALNLDLNFIIRKNGPTNPIDEAVFNQLDLLLDQTKLSLSGNIKQNKIIQFPKLNLSLEISNWNALLDNLYKKQVISKGKQEVILEAINKVTGGIQENNPIKTSIFSTANNQFMIGRMPLLGISMYVNKFITTP